MKSLRVVSPYLFTLLVSACVTINVYFPAAAAESAADRIIEDILDDRLQQQKASPAAQPQSAYGAEPVTLVAIAGEVLAWVIPAAEAAEANLNIDTPAIRSLRAAMKKRYESLKPYYAGGAIGYTRDGLVGIRDIKAVSLKQRATVNSLVANENQDRNALYKEIARSNGHPEWEKDIRATFSRRWPDNSPAGWWHQDTQGNWKQK